MKGFHKAKYQSLEVPPLPSVRVFGGIEFPLSAAGMNEANEIMRRLHTTSGHFWFAHGTKKLSLEKNFFLKDYASIK